MGMSRLTLLPLALATLLLAGCGDKQPAALNEAAGDSGLEQENVVAGDVTAIDAAMADDARMADDRAPPAPGENAPEAANAEEAEENEG